MTKTEKLLKRNIEADTKILMEHLVDFGEFPGLMEKWIWDGITASTIIILEEDVRERMDGELIQFLFEKMKQPVDPHTTISRKDGYVYVNYGFAND